MSETMSLGTVRMYARQCQEESDRIDAMPPGPQRDQRLSDLLRYLNTRWLMIPENLRREALNDSASGIARTA